jgi:hypothetical protein
MEMMQMLRVSIRKMKALTVKTETVTLTGEGTDCEDRDSDTEW